MDLGVALQYLTNGLLLGVNYALVAVGFTLFFGVLDLIKFSHGDVLMVGAFSALVCSLALKALGVSAPALLLPLVVLAPLLVTALLGAAMGRWLVLPLRRAPPLNVLLMTLMGGTALREAVRLFYPNGANPKPFPRLLPTTSLQFGELTLRADSLILLLLGLSAIVGVSLLLGRTRMGLAIRAVSQDSETARVMGIPFERVVLLTFALGSALAGLAGVVHGLYYNEVSFTMGLLLGVTGFAAAVVGGLGNIYGAILGGFLFAALQTAGAVLFPVPAYKDAFAFAVVILLMALRPTGLIAERGAERV